MQVGGFLFSTGKSTLEGVWEPKWGWVGVQSGRHTVAKLYSRNTMGPTQTPFCCWCQWRWGADVTADRAIDQSWVVGRDSHNTALVIKCFKVKGTNMVTVGLEQKVCETNLDLIPSQQTSKTTVTTSHQSDAIVGKKWAFSWVSEETWHQTIGYRVTEVLSQHKATPAGPTAGPLLPVTARVVCTWRRGVML